MHPLLARCEVEPPHLQKRSCKQATYLETPIHTGNGSCHIGDECIPLSSASHATINRGRPIALRAPDSLSLGQALDKEDDWTGIKDAKSRRKIQNRLNVRAYRQCIHDFVVSEAHLVQVAARL